MSDEIKPGLYPGMPFSDYYSTDAISSGLLNAAHRSLAHARIELTHPSEPTAAQAFGTAFHTAVLEPSDFDKRYTVAPKIDRRTTKGKEEWAAFLAANKGRETLTRDEMGAIQDMAQSVHEHGTAGKMLASATMREASAFWQESGVLCRARFDALTKYDGWSWVVDLKSAADASPEAFRRSVTKWGYHRQAAWYLRGAYALAPVRRRFAFIVVEKTPPHAVAVYELTDDAIEQGGAECEEAFAALVRARDTNTWPGYPDEVVEIDLPPWARRMVEDV